MIPHAIDLDHHGRFAVIGGKIIRFFKSVVNDGHIFKQYPGAVIGSDNGDFAEFDARNPAAH